MMVIQIAPILAYNRMRGMQLLLEMTGTSTLWTQNTTNFDEPRLSAFAARILSHDMVKLDSLLVSATWDSYTDTYTEQLDLGHYFAAFWTLLAYSSDDILEKYALLLGGNFSWTFPGTKLSWRNDCRICLWQCGAFCLRNAVMTFSKHSTNLAHHVHWHMLHMRFSLSAMLQHVFFELTGSRYSVSLIPAHVCDCISAVFSAIEWAVPAGAWPSLTSAIWVC